MQLPSHAHGLFPTQGDQQMTPHLHAIYSVGRGNETLRVWFKQICMRGDKWVVRLMWGMHGNVYWAARTGVQTAVCGCVVCVTSTSQLAGSARLTSSIDGITERKTERKEKSNFCRAAVEENQQQVNGTRWVTSFIISLELVYRGRVFYVWSWRKVGENPNTVL